MATSIVVISGEQRSTRRILRVLQHAGYTVTGPIAVDALHGVQVAELAGFVVLLEIEPLVMPGQARPASVLDPPQTVGASRAFALRPLGGGPSFGETIEVGHLGIDVALSEVRVAGKLVKLRTKEFGLLVALARAAGGVLTRQELLQRVWGYPCPITSRTVDVHVTWLRGKLAGGAVRIEGIRGLGYRLLPEPDALVS